MEEPAVKRMKQEIQCVMIESPYSGDIEKNVEYAWRCLQDSYFTHKEAPFLSHLLWTKLTPNEVGCASYVPDSEEGRERALLRCREMRKKIGVCVFYLDRGWSGGMKIAHEECKEDGVGVIFRYLDLPKE